MPLARRLSRVPNQPKRVVLYVRVSALMARGGDDFHSPSVQTSAMRRLTAGMREVAVVEDIDRTGRHFDREGIDKIRRLAEQGAIDALAVYDVSRLGRNVRESLTFLAELADLGVTILSACEQVDTSSPAGRLMLTNMLAIAEYRSDEIGRSWSAAIARRAENGRQHGRAIGYLKVDKQMTVDPILGPVVAKAWRDYAAGVPIAQICRDVAAARGKPIATSNLKTMFHRQLYLGHVTSRGEVVVKDAHPALVDRDTWEAVQLRLARDRRTPPRNLEVTWSLVGLVFCACGYRLQRQPHKRNGTVEQRLCCGMVAGRAAGSTCSGVGRPLLAEVEREVLRQIQAYVIRLRTDDVARSEQLLRRNLAVTDEGALRRRLNQVQDAIGRLAKAWALEDITEAEFRRGSVELRAEASALQERLVDLGPIESRPTPEGAANAAEALLALWPEMDASERSRALRAVVDRVAVRRAERWREPEADRVKVYFL